MVVAALVGGLRYKAEKMAAWHETVAEAADPPLRPPPGLPQIPEEGIWGRGQRNLITTDGLYRLLGRYITWVGCWRRIKASRRWLWQRGRHSAARSRRLRRI